MADSLTDFRGYLGHVNLDEFIFVHSVTSLSCLLVGYTYSKDAGISGSVVHIGQQHVVNQLQDIQRDALPMLQG